MPLPGGYSWLLTTEIGGYDCRGKTYDSNGNVIWPDKAHQGLNYFSIDFSPTGSGYSGSIPVLAALGGKVIFAGKFDLPDPRAANGYHVIIDHDGDGISSTGFQTRYLHLADLPKKKNGTLLIVGNTVDPGDQIGIMGNTGASDGTHLHFGVRYQDDGSASKSELTNVIMEGLLLKSYQSECQVDASGAPTTWIRRYPSTLYPSGK